MEHSILVAAREPGFLLGMTQALLKFGYIVRSSDIQPSSLEQAAQLRAELVVLSPPQEAQQRHDCLELVGRLFVGRGIQSLVCVPTREEAREIEASLRGAQALGGSPLSLNGLYMRLQKAFDLARRRELRIGVELAVAHRRPGKHPGSFYHCHAITSLSPSGCFIRADDPPPLGATLEMMFCPGVSSHTVSVRGSVRHHGDSRPGSALHGMGVQFEELRLADRALVEAYLLTLAGTPVLPATL